jgi:hypothetical protein
MADASDGPRAAVSKEGKFVEPSPKETTYSMEEK